MQPGRPNSFFDTETGVNGLRVRPIMLNTVKDGNSNNLTIRRMSKASRKAYIIALALLSGLALFYSFFGFEKARSYKENPWIIDQSYNVYLRVFNSVAIDQKSCNPATFLAYGSSFTLTVPGVEKYFESDLHSNSTYIPFYFSDSIKNPEELEKIVGQMHEFNREIYHECLIFLEY